MRGRRKGGEEVKGGEKKKEKQTIIHSDDVRVC